MGFGILRNEQSMPVIRHDGQMRDVDLPVTESGQFIDDNLGRGGLPQWTGPMAGIQVFFQREKLPSLGDD